MKTAEEWANELDPINNGKTLVRVSREEIKQIQLDAMKEGMRIAATVTDNVPLKLARPHGKGYVYDKEVAMTQQNIKKAILTAIEQLTEKDL